MITRLRKSDLLGRSAENAQDPDLIRLLGLDKLMSVIVKDGKDLTVFLDVAARSVNDPYESAARREMLREFLSQRDICTSLRISFEAPPEMLREYYGKIAPNNGNQSNDKHPIRTAAVLALRVIAWIKHTAAKYSELRFESNLKLIPERLRILADSDYLDDISSVCQSILKQETDPHTHSVSFSLGTEGTVVSVSYMLPCDLDASQSMRTIPIDTVELDELAETSLKRALEAFVVAVADEFCDISEVLRYYSAATDFCDYLVFKGVKSVFPRFFRDTPLSIKEYYPLELLINANFCDIVPITFDTDIPGFGAVTVGDNGAGKSTFVRAVTTAVLFAQIGLPVPCGGCRMPFFGGIKVFSLSNGSSLWTKRPADRVMNLVHAVNGFAEDACNGHFVMFDDVLECSNYSKNGKLLDQLIALMLKHHGTAIAEAKAHQLTDDGRTFNVVIGTDRSVRIVSH